MNQPVSPVAFGASARGVLKAATQAAHEALETTPPMQAVTGPAPDAAGVAAAIRGQAAVIGAIEARLAWASDAVAAAFADYRPRAPLARADLLALGDSGDWPALVPPHLDTQAAWLGFRYVVEGSSLGGALIRRHLTEHAPALPPLRFFDPHGARRGAVWRGFCEQLDTALPGDGDRAAAVAAALAVFAALKDSLTAQAAP